VFIKTLRILLFIVSGTLAASCKTGADRINEEACMADMEQGKAEISFSEYEHNFGKVTQGEKIGCVFNFRNTGTGNLVIASASTSCGCTVPRYDARPIPPGDAGTLEVIFDTSGRNGLQTKTISVKTNAVTPVTVLKITAEILKTNNK